MDTSGVKLRKCGPERRKPVLFLTLDSAQMTKPPADYLETNPGKDTKENKRALFVTDLQNLVMGAFFPQKYTALPRWCHLKKPLNVPCTVMIVCENLSAEEFDRLAPQLDAPLFASQFEKRVDFVCPSAYGFTMEKEFFQVPLHFLTCSATSELLKLDETKSNSKSKSLPADYKDSFPRTQLLLSPDQMASEDFPIPTANMKYDNIVPTKDIYTVVTDSSPMFGLDCEMVITKCSELARVTLVNERHEVLYDELVKPYTPVVNYLTEINGITKAMLEPVTKRLHHVQQELGNILPRDAILVGHSLNCDLNALQMFHPYVIDTSVIYNLNRNRTRKSKLKMLTEVFLGRQIQNSKNGHCSAEDAVAALELVQLKLSKDLTFGDSAANTDTGEEDAPEAKRQRLNSEENPSSDEEKLTSTVNNQPSYQRHFQFLTDYAETSQHMLSVLELNRVSTSIIGPPERLQSLSIPKLNADTCVHLFEASSDRSAVKKLEKLISVDRFAVLYLRRFNATTESSEEKKVKLLSKLTAQIQTVCDTLPPNALIMLVFPGVTDRPHEHGRCHITLRGDL